MDILRFTTVGSVDDGKSTLIGRLLFDTGSIFEDQLRAVQKTSDKKGYQGIDLSLVTDGLAAEREQGITIDVAYRYFSSPKRRFIIADTPGHKQYTRNMVTGASTADLTIILIDARKGLLEQSRRHAFISSLLGIPNFVVAINKMDLVDYSQEVFEQIQKDFQQFISSMKIDRTFFLPISALKGDNVVLKSEKTPWYQGPSLLELLETIDTSRTINYQNFRFPVQYVIREDSEAMPDFRGFAGQIASGIVKVGDELISLPSRQKARLQSISSFDGDLDEAAAPSSVTLVLDREIDTSRGDMLVKIDDEPEMLFDFSADICWMTEEPLLVRNRYIMKYGSSKSKVIINNIDYRINTDSLEHENAHRLDLNDIGRISLKALKAIALDKYKNNRATGSFILIDEISNNTVAAGMVA